MVGEGYGGRGSGESGSKRLKITEIEASPVHLRVVAMQSTSVQKPLKTEKVIERSPAVHCRDHPTFGLVDPC